MGSIIVSAPMRACRGEPSRVARPGFKCAATDNDVTVIEDDRLPRCDCALRLVESDADSLPFTLDRRGHLLRLVPHLGVDANSLVWRIDGHPVHRGCIRLLREELRLIAYHDRVGIRPDLGDKQRATGCNAEPTPLPHRKERHTVVVAEYRAARIQNRTFLRGRWHMVAQIITVVAVGNETYLLALELVCDVQAQLVSQLPRVVFGLVAKRE